MLRPIFYTFCNLTEDKEDSSRRVRAWNEQVSEDRTVDEWNWEWIDKIFFFFFSKKMKQVHWKYSEECKRQANKYDIYTYIQIYFILYTFCSRFIKYFLCQIFLSVQRIINKRLPIRREFS